MSEHRRKHVQRLDGIRSTEGCAMSAEVQQKIVAFIDRSIRFLTRYGLRGCRLIGSFEWRLGTDYDLKEKNCF